MCQRMLGKGIITYSDITFSSWSYNVKRLALSSKSSFDESVFQKLWSFRFIICRRLSSDIPFVRSNFPRSKFDFLQRLSRFREILLISEKSKKIFFNGFPISSPAFRFLKRLSDFFDGFPIFLNGFPLSEKSGNIWEGSPRTCERWLIKRFWDGEHFRDARLKLRR